MSFHDFESINRSGKIAMKLEDGDQIAGVEICTNADDVLLTTALGQCIRLPVNDVRVFKGRDSTGVRGIKLEEGDHVISMASFAMWMQRRKSGWLSLKCRAPLRAKRRRPKIPMRKWWPMRDLSQERYAAMGAAEQVILTVSSNGYGKRTSSFEYRITNRGGKGIVAMAVNDRNGPLVASFPVEHSDQIMLVTDGGTAYPLPG